ncbi:aminoglycoside phosphotransferase family protein [Rhizobium rhizoryzae]|uniref:Aminoglycoside phosphotransferase (APT) family kinase protein n=1 Tax=Rhizobium rhizoryzae TaxID=451876 RepID=A0A7W6LKV3_9HYPH|nr:aminoglycoside phosphotransferase family protein [Rhizobium rhizoryzae]MBB4146194.1 aminoglycoside phosphotransferase (APT) family kinase protein [Rhizobium rhizoryzae]
MLHDDEIRVDVITASSLIHNQFPEFVDEEIQPFHTGTDNAVFRIGLRATARFPLRPVEPDVRADTLRHESMAMDEFADHCPVPTPRPIGIGKPGDGYPMPWAVQSWVAGVVATPNGLSTSRAFADDIANLIAALRRADTRQRQFCGQGRGGSLGDHEAWMDTCFKMSEALLDVPKLRRLWERFRALPPHLALAMCHKDLIPANLLVDGERLIGVLDCGGCGPADPALDLVAAWHLFERNERDIVRVRLGCDDVEWERGAAWAFQQAMGLVWYYLDSHPGMAELGRSTLNRITTAPEFSSN